MHRDRDSDRTQSLAVRDRLPTRPRLLPRGTKLLAVLFVLVYIVPVVASAALYYFGGNYVDWRSADRSSTGLLPSAADNPQPAVRIFSARTVSWRGIVASHSWVVIKDQNAKAYQRFDYTAWGRPIWVDRFAPDARWFGSKPEVVFAADGARAAAMIPTIKLTIQNYRYSKTGDYKLWPGPNSNTFVAAVMQSVPGMDASLPPTAIGKDFPYNDRWIGLTPSRTGVRLNLQGYFGVTLGWVEGVELNILGAVAGLDLRRPALKLPGLGRIALWH
jgi:Protein of unknown function (DUF3750)